MKLLGLCLVLLPTSLASAPARPRAQEQAPPLRAGELQEELDRSLHWLRDRQERETGGYGGVWTTIQALRAFAEGPRAYRSPDGPFISRAVVWLAAQQRPDGSFTDPSAPGVEGAATTRAAADVLGWFEWIAT